MQILQYINKHIRMQEELEMYKIVVIGSSGVGKTNISTRFVRDYFNEVSQATLGVEFMTKEVEVNGRTVKISLWDTAGQERYKALSKVYYKGASGAIVVYDITDAKSYVDLDSWMRLLNENLNLEDIVLAVVGNKADMEERRQVPRERPVQQYKQAFDIDCWEVSAKTGNNISQLFGDMIKKILEKANDVKSTMYRGTVQYAESERGTYIPVKQEGVNGVNNPSIIIEEEEDERSNAEVRRAESTVQPLNRLTLSPAERFNHKLTIEQNKKKKCCLAS